MRVARPSSLLPRAAGLRAWRRALLPASVIALGAWSSSCSPAGFASDAIVASVRIFATSADKPYAQPGDTVTLSVLAFDGRSAAQRTDPMNVSWLPIACENPLNDAYYNCFTQPELGFVPEGGIPLPPSDAGATGDASSDAGPPVACSGLDPDAGIPTPVVAGFQFTVPATSVSSHAVVPGAGAPYGLEIRFNVACAGTVMRVPLDPNNGNPQQIPVACVGSNGQTQGPDNYVFGFTRVYTHEADAGLTNANPVVDGVDFPDAPGDAGWPTCFQGSSPTYSTGVLFAPLCPIGTKSCPHVKLGPIVPPSSQETDPQNGKELLWVDYYSTFGGFNSSSRLLYDPAGGDVGGLTKTDTEFEPPIVGPNDPHDGYIFMAVHDNRGGASWVIVPVHLQ
jgi:hypothetical protein